jgi:hypothetical protein
MKKDVVKDKRNMKNIFNEVLALAFLPWSCPAASTVSLLPGMSYLIRCSVYISKVERLQ